MYKKLPVGISDFAEIRETDCAYVDKTLLISEWLASRSKVTLITRPRRFGKTLAMTMLREFFDITKESGALFAGLAVMETPEAAQMNQWPVLFLSLKECKGDRRLNLSCVYRQLIKLFDCYASAQESLSELQREQWLSFKMVLTTMDLDKSYLLGDALLFLSQMLYQHYHKKVIILLDEYDTPMINAYEQGYYEDVRFFFKSLYGSALKDNPYLERAMLTGIHRIAKESIFSDLNNLDVYTALDTEYSACFGLTPAETEALLAEYDLSLTADVRAMYDGYLIGEQELYNPWSIINYAKRQALIPFWANTATNELLGRVILEGDVGIGRDFEQLIAGDTVRLPVNVQVSFFEMRQPATLWGLFLNSGYLTLAQPVQTNELQTAVRIPNDEVLSSFREIVSRYAGFANNSLERLFDALLHRDLAAFKRHYAEIVLDNTSYYDAKEHAYHLLFLGMCVYLRSYYRVFSNQEFGHGRPDIRLEAKRPGLCHVIMEFKYGEDVEALAQAALRQIHDQEYAAGLSGDVLLLGIAHHKKRCQIEEAWVTQ